MHICCGRRSFKIKKIMFFCKVSGHFLYIKKIKVKNLQYKIVKYFITVIENPCSSYETKDLIFYSDSNIFDWSSYGSYEIVFIYLQEILQRYI